MKALRLIAPIAVLCAFAIPGAFASVEQSPVSSTDAQKSGTTPPQFLSGKDPQYTEDARNANIEGTVILTVKINEKGRVTNVVVKNSLEKGLDRNAVKAVKHWKFEPAKVNGQPVATETNVSVDFRMNR